jgi:hypothetical protein
MINGKRESLPTGQICGARMRVVFDAANDDESPVGKVDISALVRRYAPMFGLDQVHGDRFRGSTAKASAKATESTEVEGRQ